VDLVPTVSLTRTPGADGDQSFEPSSRFHDLSGGEARAGGVLPARSLADASSNDRVWPDPLLLVPPPVYFERLTGLRVGRSGKLRCLFHDDQHPSLHVYPKAGRGWYCFGCGRGGSVYDLAALLWGRTTRGEDFVELRRELEGLLL
jgi:CHC2 zinc finger